MIFGTIRNGGSMIKNKKQLGQNWLKDRNILLSIAALAASPDCHDAIEIGAGLGTLTSALFHYFDRVIAIEYDQTLAQQLPQSFPGKDLAVLHADALSLQVSRGCASVTRPSLQSAKLSDNYVIAGNIPYYITSPIIDTVLSLKHPPSKIVLLLQKEVAERIAATTGQHSVLSLSTQARAQVSLGDVVKREYFTPVPKVDSRLIIMKPRQQSLLEPEELRHIKALFKNPRKKLATNLSSHCHISRAEALNTLINCGVNQDVRPADLSFANWHELLSKLHLTCNNKT